MSNKIVEFLQEERGHNHLSVKTAVTSIIKAYGQVEPESIYKTYTEGELYFSCNRKTGALHVTCKDVTVFDDSVSGVMSDSGDGLPSGEGWIEQVHEIAESITVST